MNEHPKRLAAPPQGPGPETAPEPPRGPRALFRALSGAILLAAAVPALALPAASPEGATAALTAQAPAPGPVEVVRERNDSVQRILEAAGDSLDAPTRERLKDVINGLIDFRALSARALGRHWDDRTEEEKEEFVDVFRELIRNSSVRKLGIYRADSVAYHDPETADHEAEVRTVGYKGRNTVEIVYEMHRSDGEWKATDVVVDGSSTVRTYRDAFNREIAATSYDAMYRRLVEKLEREGRAEG